MQAGLQVQQCMSLWCRSAQVYICQAICSPRMAVPLNACAYYYDLLFVSVTAWLFAFTLLLSIDRPCISSGITEYHSC
jgi:hypothetical protein